MVDEWEDVEVKHERKTTTLMITVEHIRKAMYLRSQNADQLFNDPISLAIKEHTGAKWAMTGWGYARTGHENNVYKEWSLFPFKDARDFMKSWDNNHGVTPTVINMYQEREVDKTPRAIKRRLPKRKNFSELQMELELK